METKIVTRSKTFEISDVKEFNSKVNTFIKEINKEDIIAVNYSTAVLNNTLVHCANIIFRKEVKVTPKTEVTTGAPAAVL